MSWTCSGRRLNIASNWSTCSNSEYGVTTGLLFLAYPSLSQSGI